MAEQLRWYEKYKNELLMGFAAFALLILIIGLALAWFFGGLSASTVGRVKAPAEISILGPNETYMEQIDLSYDKSEVKDGVVTLERPFCVSSPSEKFDLFLAHTTNIDDLDIKLYEAAERLQDASGDNIIKGIDSKGKPYTWEKISNMFSDDGYLNKKQVEDKLAEESGEYHSATFGEYSKVQENSEPLYWYREITAPKQNSEGNYVGNYVLVLSWTERVKETDIIYLIAKNK